MSETSNFELVFIPCEENHPQAVGGYQSYDGQSMCHVREGHVPTQPPAVKGAGFVKATVRLPDHGRSVIIRGYLNEQGYDNHRFVAYGFRTYNPEHKMYFEYGNRSFLTNDVEWLDESPTAAQSDEHPHQSLFDQYHDIKEKIGKLGYNTFINSKEVEEYREWLRNYKYKHRLEWFEKEYPNGLYSKDDVGDLFGISIMTKKFLAEADAAYDQPTAAGDGKEDDETNLIERVLQRWAGKSEVIHTGNGDFEIIVRKKRG